MNGHYEVGEVVLGNWTLIRLIGEGSYGKVYEAQRVDFGVTYRAAIKIITIPQSQSEVKSARAEGMDDVSVTAYFRGFVEDLVQEFVLMSKLKGHSNIVSYEDHAVQEHDDGIGWDIIIRMELLTPLLDYIQKRDLDRGDIISLGIGMCRALEVCHKYNIVHRDIKPENIFVSQLGDYKLGDFGIARTVEKTTGGLSKKGTYTYMAPEVYKEEPYNSSVDLYSLGIVMYRLLNDNRTPFLPAAPTPIKYSDRDKALVQRMSGVEIPPPKNADDRLAEVVLKACAYDAKERYNSPTLMRRELESLQQQEVDSHQITIHENIRELVDAGNAEKTTSMFVQHEDGLPDKEELNKTPDRTVSMFGQATTQPQECSENGLTKKSKKPLLLAGIGVAAVLIVGIIAIGTVSSHNSNVEGRETVAVSALESAVSMLEEQSNVATTIPVSSPIVTSTPNEAQESTASTEAEEPSTPVEHTYQVIAQDVSWQEAKNLCESQGGYLATITSEEEYETIVSLLDSSGLEYAWIGGEISTTSNCGTWITGEPWDFEKWYPGEPSHYSGENIEDKICIWNVEIDGTRTDWTFNDVPGELPSVNAGVMGKLGYVCEYD